MGGNFGESFWGRDIVLILVDHVMMSHENNQNVDRRDNQKRCYSIEARVLCDRAVVTSKRLRTVSDHPRRFAATMLTTILKRQAPNQNNCVQSSLERDVPHSTVE